MRGGSKGGRPIDPGEAGARLGEARREDSRNGQHP